MIPRIRIEVAKAGDEIALDEAYKIAIMCDQTNSYVYGGKPYQSYQNHTFNRGSPMDVDNIDRRGQRMVKVRLTDEEKEKLKNNNGCYYCRKLNAGHIASYCPEKTKRKQDGQALEKEEQKSDSERSTSGCDSEGYVFEVNLVELEHSNNKKTRNNKILFNKINYFEPPYESNSEIEQEQNNIRSQKNPNKSEVKSSAKPRAPKSPGDNSDWQLNPSVSKQIFQEWGYPTVDLFATAINSQAPFYYRAPNPDLPMAKGCLGEDAFKTTWDFQELVYCNPPWDLIENSIKKIIEDKPRKIIVIAPVNRKLEEMSKEKRKLTHKNNLFIPKSRQLSQTGVGKPPWKETYAYLITNNQELQNSIPMVPTVSKINRDHQNIKSSSSAPSPQTRIIPRISERDSRFIFRAFINKKPCTILVDSGCTVNIISRDFAKKASINIYETEKVNLSMADNSPTSTTSAAIVQVERNHYLENIECYVSTIKYDVMLGTPWLESIIITDLQWHSRSFSFVNRNDSKSHTWRALSRPSSTTIRRVSYQSPQEFIRNTQWCAIIDLNQITESEESANLDQINEHQNSTTNDKIKSSRVDKIHENNNRLIEAHRKDRDRERQSKSAIPVPETTNNNGMYHYKPELEERTNKSTIPEKTFSDFVQRFGNQLLEPDTLPPEREDNHKITLTEDNKIPPWRPISALSEFELTTLKNWISTNIDRGFISHSKSPFGSNILFAKKKDGSLRICIDYRGLNNITIKDRTPLPNIKEMMQRARGAKIFTKIDLRDGFHNILIHEDDRHKTAFRTRFGHFQFNVLPFGLCNSPATFMRVMNKIFGHLYDEFIIAYMDDILIFSDSLTQHIEHLNQVFQILEQHQLFVKPEKCQFGVDETTFCGTVISKDGISLDKSKLPELFGMPIPKSVKDIQSFMGMCNWFRDFIPEFSVIGQPLTELTKKNTKFSWTEREHSAVIHLLHLISSAPCLRYFDPKLETVVYTDASEFGIGGWIGQKHDDGLHPTIFWSRKLIPAETRYPTHERELLALVKLCTKNRALLLGKQFTAFTDHRALKFIQSQPYLTSRQARWVESLQEFDIKIAYVPGELNQLADLLSRKPTYAPLCSRCKQEHLDMALCEGGEEVEKAEDSQSAISKAQEDTKAKDQEEPEKIEIIQNTISNDYIYELRTDKEILPILQKYYKNNQEEMSRKQRKLELIQRNNLYYYKDRLYIPDHEQLRLKLLQQAHDIPIAGHQGQYRTVNKLKTNVYWESLREDCTNFINSCDTCQRVKASNKPPEGLLIPLEIPETRFEIIGIDFKPLPKSSEGFDNLMIIICKLTKITALIPTTTKITAREAAELFFRHWYCRGFGLPKKIISDRDKIFVSTFWQEITNTMQIKLNMSTARHQQTNGVTENVVKIVKNCLSSLCAGDPKKWPKQIEAVEFALNSSKSTTTGYTPFALAFGYLPREMPKESNKIDLQEIINKAKSNIARAQDKAEVAANKYRTIPKEISKGELVLLNREGINWPEDDQDSDHKLESRRIGPFRVIDKDPERENYKLELPAKLRIFPWFHRSVITKYNLPSSDFKGRIDVPVFQNQYPDIEYEVEAILGERKLRKRKQYKIRWLGYGPEHDSWEPAENINAPELIDIYQQSKGGVAVEQNKSKEFNLLDLRLNLSSPHCDQKPLKEDMIKNAVTLNKPQRRQKG